MRQYGDDDQGDDEDDLTVAETGLLDVGRGGGLDADADVCAACGEDMPEMVSGEGAGGMLCPDCDDGEAMAEVDLDRDSDGEDGEDDVQW